MTRGQTTSTYFIDILKQKIIDLDAVEATDITARPLLVTAVRATQTAADTNRSALDPDTITNPVTVPLGSLDAANLNQLITEIKNATSYAQAMTALDGFVARFGTTRAISADVLAAITALKTNPVGAFATTLTTTGPAPTAASTFDEQLKPKLLEVANLIPPVLANLTASDALKAQALVHQTAVDAVKDAAIDAFIEANLTNSEQKNVGEIRKIYDGFKTLREMWDIAPDITKLDRLKSDDLGIAGVFNNQLAVSGQGLLLKDQTGAKEVTATQKEMTVSDNLSVEELKSVLECAYKTFGKDGLDITVLKKNKVLAARMAAAADLLANETGENSYKNYQLIVKGKYWGSTIWAGAAAQVGNNKLKHISEQHPDLYDAAIKSVAAAVISDPHNTKIDPVQSALYQRFFATHVTTGVTTGMLQTLTLDKAIEGQSKETAEFMKRFAKEVGVNELIFTNEGTWIIPPKMRQAFPEYKKYLMENPDGKMAGTAAITFAQNKPIPMYDADGNQIGGFENNAFHGFLTIVDSRTGKVHELHQTFLEDSNDPAFRPGIVSINEEYAKVLGLSKQQLLDLIKDPKTALDDVGMLEGKETRLVSYQCELVPSPDKAFNWNNGINGSNFNYNTIAALEFGIGARQMDALLWDRELAIREGGVKSKPRTTAKQNETGFEPAIREGVYPDGTERYVIATEETVDGEKKTVFRNAAPDATGKVPAGAIRVLEYDTVVRGEDMQVVEPYNNHGGSKHMAGSANCFKAVASMLDNVCAHQDISTDVMTAISAKGTSESALQRLLMTHFVKGALNRKTIEVTLPTTGANKVTGNVTVYNAATASGAIYNMIDFGGMSLKMGGKALLASVLARLGKDVNDPELAGVVGKAIAMIEDQQKKADADGKRPPESELLILPVGTTGEVLRDQIHPTIYAANNNARPADASLLKRWASGSIFRRRI